MERVPDIVANVFTESGIQIGTLTVEEHQKIMKAALRNKNNYIEQAKNAGIVFLKSFFVTLKTFLLIAAIIFSVFFIFHESEYNVIDDFIFNRGATLSSIGIGSQEEGFLILFSMLFLTIFSLNTSFQIALILLLLSLFDCAVCIMFLSSKGRMERYTKKEERDKFIKAYNGKFDFSFQCIEMLGILGQKNMFQMNIDTEIKKALQEQSDCKIVVKYQESN